MKKRLQKAVSFDKQLLLKIVIMSKLCLLIIICSTFTIYAGTYAQNVKINLEMKDTHLNDVVNAIKQQTEFEFAYDANLESFLFKNVSIKAQNESIDKVMAKILQNSNINYKIIDKIILLSRSSVKITAGLEKGSTLQKQKVNGAVTDGTTGEIIVGASVIIEGTTLGTITDVNGKFSLDIPKQNCVLVISFMGYNSEHLNYSGQSILNVKLTPDIKRLNEVIVIGYGTQQKKDLTGSIVSVSTKELALVPVPSIGDALQGKAAGVQIISAGAPGSNPTFRIRGTGTINNNDPLIVIDGVPYSSGLNQVNMTDFESIQILKDASATAIYGSRGANGVVILTTKRGKGDQPHLNMNYYYGFQNATNMVEMLNASEFAQMHNEMLAAAGLVKNPAFANPASLGTGTDWLGSLFRTAPTQSYSVSYSTSGEKSNFYVSGNYYNRDGIVIGTGFKRYVVQFNSDTKILKWLKFGNSLKLEHDLKPSGNYSIQNTMLALPTQPILRADGNYSGPIAQPLYDGNITNPIGAAKMVQNNTKGYNIHGSEYVEIEPITGLIFKSNLGIEANFWNDRTWSPKFKWDAISQDNSYLHQRSSNSITWLWDNTLTYNKVFNDVHHLTVMGGTSAQSNHYEFMDGSVQNFASDLTQQLTNGTQQPTITGNASEWALMSYMGRVNYGYAEKYLITGTIRRDGSSRFGSGYKWGTFPSGSVAWRISKEDFFKSISFVNDLKIRAGYGVTGNQEIGNYSFASSLNTIKYNFNGNIINAVVPNMMPNPNVKWESQEQSNIGLDASLLNDRIGIVVDAYIKNTKDMLVPMSVPVSTGYSDVSVPFINAGKIENKGIEFTISTKNLTGKFTWNTDLNFSFNRNKVISINDTVPQSTGSIGLNYNLALIQAGHPINEFYGFVTDGIFQTQADVNNHAVQVPGNDPNNRTSPGDIRFKDLNSDGVINDKDRTYIGNPNPKCIYSLNNSFSYKGFDLNIFIQGVYGNKIFNANRFYTEAMSVAQNQTTETLYRWVGPGTSNSMPRAVFNDPNKNTRVSDRYIEDGSHIRLKTVTLGYNLPKSLLQHAKITSAKIYVSGQNLFTITKYKGFDPEVPVSGIDNNVYPVTRTISCGINLNF
ncbi:MAG: TonB-dependent receptor [Bacteroidetes bacterium]|nr:TonB-dependent receptor [Bacteroidota bacterium]